MKKFLALLMTLCCINAFAQYTDITVQHGMQNAKIVQIDYRESSTLVFIQYTALENIDVCSINERTYAKGPDGQRFHLINSINLPITTEAESHSMVFDYMGQRHNFVLEFEKIPEKTTFSIIEDENNPQAFNFYNIHVSENMKSDFMNLDNFIARTPLKEMGQYIRDDQIITYIKAKDIILTCTAQPVNKYGKYYMVMMDIQNYSGKSILFSMNNISATGYIVKDNAIKEQFSLDILTANEYDKKVKKRQMWEKLGAALNSTIATYNAGKTTITTTSSGNVSTTANANAFGYAGNTYGYGHAYSSAYTTAYGKARIEINDGYAAYLANQKADEEFSNFETKQYEIREQLYTGYVKNNTIQNQVEYAGFFNIKQPNKSKAKEINVLRVVFTINGEQFPFIFK